MTDPMPIHNIDPKVGVCLVSTQSEGVSFDLNSGRYIVSLGFDSEFDALVMLDLLMQYPDAFRNNDEDD